MTPVPLTWTPLMFPIVLQYHDLGLQPTLRDAITEMTSADYRCNR